jgi:hypothetical protein
MKEEVLMERSRILVMALAVVALVTLLPDHAFAAPCSNIRIATTSAERAALWNEAIDRFTAERRGLTAEQTQFLSDAARLGDEIATLQQDEREQAAFARKATRLMEQARELFTKNELGALFTSMGTTQIWLAQVAAVPAYCNCPGPGPCQMPGGGPNGTCVTGCVSWTGTGGDMTHICTPTATPTPRDPVEPTVD